MLSETNQAQPRQAYRMLMVITTAKLAQKASLLMDRSRVPLQYRVAARGTASSEMLEMLGLGSSDKVILWSMMPRFTASALLKKMQIELGLGAINSGIAFTVPISGCSSVVMQMMQALHEQDINRQTEKDVSQMNSCKFSLIMAIVDQGYSEELMNAARPVGARGGTVFHSRRFLNEKTRNFWDISIQPEREIVLVVVATEQKKAVMQAMSEICGFRSKAHGVVFSLPVDDAIGLSLPSDE